MRRRQHGAFGAQSLPRFNTDHPGAPSAQSLPAARHDQGGAVVVAAAAARRKEPQFEGLLARFAPEKKGGMFGFMQNLF